MWHTYFVSVNVGQSSLIAKERISCEKKIKNKKKEMCWKHFNDSSTHIHSNLLCIRLAVSVSLTLYPSGLSPETMEHLVSEKGHKWRGCVTFPHFCSSDFLLHSTAACCVLFFSLLTDCAVCSRPVVMTSQSPGLSVRCTSPWVWLPGGACIVSARAKSITRRLYLQSNFIPPACVEDWARSLV